jgi:hypothetical protein
LLIERPLSVRAAVDFAEFAARLEAAPFQNSSQVELPAGFPGLTCMPLVIVAAAAASATKALSTAASAARRVGLRLCLVDLQGAASEFRSIQSGYCPIGFRCIGHFDEAEAAGASGFAVGDNADFLDCAMRLKQAAQLWFGGAVR